MRRDYRFASRLLIGAFVLGSCAYGGNIRKIPAATSGVGATASMRVWHGGNRMELTGELLTVEAGALTLLVEQGDTLAAILRVRTDALITLYFEGTGFGRSGDRPNARTVERWRLMSRYPMGLTEDQWAALLSHHGLDAVTPYGEPRRR
jgi:hypothetical protein